MSELTTLAFAVLISVWVVLLWWNDIFLKSIAAALCLLIFGAGFAQTLIPARFVLAMFAVIFIISMSIKYRASLGNSGRALILAGPAACFLIFGITQAFVEPEVMDPLFRYTILFPLMFIAGFLTSRIDGGALVWKVFVYLALAMAALAILERLQGSFLVAGDYDNAERLIRDSAVRSIVGAEHPLVLSVLLVAAIPLVQTTFSHRGWRLMPYALLFAGIFSTNSRGAMALAALWFVFSWVLNTQLLKRTGSLALRTLAGTAAGIGLVWLLAGTGSESLSSTSAIDASAEYRSSLYTFAVRSLIEQPFGWGLGGLPEGVYVVASYFGSLDIAKTVDSEIALAMFDFGWIGVIGIICLASFLLKSQRIKSPIGQSVLLISASGFYLALHSWAGLGSAWFLLLGLSMSCAALPTGVEKPTSSTAIIPPVDATS